MHFLSFPLRPQNKVAQFRLCTKKDDKERSRAEIQLGRKLTTSFCLAVPSPSQRRILRSFCLTWSLGHFTLLASDLQSLNSWRFILNSDRKEEWASKSKRKSNPRPPPFSSFPTDFSIPGTVQLPVSSKSGSPVLWSHLVVLCRTTPCWQIE